MAHWTAQQRYRKAKRDPYRAAQIAPSHPMPAVKCTCGHARLMHDEPALARQSRGCLSYGCDCTEYAEPEPR